MHVYEPRYLSVFSFTPSAVLLACERVHKKMGASESICHQHHTHSSQEDANDCNRRFEEALRRERQ